MKNLLLILLTIFQIFSFSTKLCFPESYTNKDVEFLKKQSQKSSPRQTPKPACKPSGTQKAQNFNTTEPSNSNVINNNVINQMKTSDKSKSYKRLGNDSKSKDTLDYQSPDGSVKIEIKSKKTITNKDVMNLKTSDKSKVYDKATKENIQKSRNEKTDYPVILTDIPVKQKLLPYEDWKQEYEDYFQKHYNDGSLVLNPKIIVLRATYGNNAESVWNLFKRGSLYNEGDDGAVYGHLSCHFIVDNSGEIYQTLPLNVRSKGAYGVNNVAITIELIGNSNQIFANNEIQIKSLYILISKLMEKFNIPFNKIYGHYQVSEGKQSVPEYTEFYDSDYPDSYSPDNVCFDPGQIFMQKLRNYFNKHIIKGKQ